MLILFLWFFFANISESKIIFRCEDGAIQLEQLPTPHNLSFVLAYPNELKALRNAGVVPPQDVLDNIWLSTRWRTNKADKFYFKYQRLNDGFLYYQITHDKEFVDFSVRWGPDLESSEKYPPIVNETFSGCRQ